MTSDCNKRYGYTPLGDRFVTNICDKYATGLYWKSFGVLSRGWDVQIDHKPGLVSRCRALIEEQKEALGALPQIEASTPQQYMVEFQEVIGQLPEDHPLRERLERLPTELSDCFVVHYIPPPQHVIGLVGLLHYTQK